MKVALIGRPNVGKSTLFNRLLGKKIALETKIPGTTRDQNRGIFYWNKIKIELIDTPGLKVKSEKLKVKSLDDEKILEYNIQRQAQRALEEVDVILYIIDFATGPMPEDYQLIRQLRRRRNRTIILVINKADKQDDQITAMKYVKLGLGEPVPVSAINGRGSGELLDRIIWTLPQDDSTQFPNFSISQFPKTINLAIIGKPNVGKSSLFNALLKEERVVVSPIPHTTRDPNNTEIIYNDYRFNLVDTAGLRKKARIYKGKKGKEDIIEIFSAKKTLESIKKAEVVLLMIDISDYLSAQDLKISQLIASNNCGLIITANKWDTVADKTPSTLPTARENIYRIFKGFNWAPIIFTDVKEATKGKVSGLEKIKVGHEGGVIKILDLVIAVKNNLQKQIPQAELMNLIRSAVKKHKPPHTRGQVFPKILSCQQISAPSPTFTITLPPNATLPQHYLGYLTNELRKKYNFFGTPIKIIITTT